MRSGSLPSTTKTKSGRSSAARGAAAPAEWRSCRWRRSARRTVLDDHHKTENAGSGLFRPTSTPRTKLVFSGLTGELETIPDCGSIWRCVQAATSLVPAGLQGESRRTRKVSAKSHCSGGLSQGTVAGEPGGKQRQVARAKRTILPGEVMRLAGAMQWGEGELHSALGLPMKPKTWRNPLAAATPLGFGGLPRRRL